MTGLRVAHVVRDHGGLTEPFIEHRLSASANLPASELWTERSVGTSPLARRDVDLRGLRPGSPMDRLFHRVPWIGPPLAREYGRAEATFAPSVIHAHYATTGYLVGSVTTAPLLVNAYGFDVTVLARRRAWRRAFAALARRAAGIVVEGPAMASAVSALGFANVVIVPISAGLEAIPFGLEPNPGPPRLLACGRFVEKKGHDLAIAAFLELAPDLPDGSNLTVVGSGPLKASLERLAAAAPRRVSITFPGAVPRDRFLDLLRHADVFLAPSRFATNGDGEGGAPTTILDAQAVGVPVVGSDHADIPFLIQDGETGFLAREGDVASLVHAIRRALEATPNRLTMTRAARARMEAVNGDEVVARQLRRLYERVAASASP